MPRSIRRRRPSAPSSPWRIEGLEPRLLLSATRVISVNFIVSTVPEGYLASTDVAGVVPVANWNNVGSSAINLKDDTGTPTIAEVGFPDITYAYSSADIVTTPDQAMMKSFRGDIGDQDFIFRNLPDSFVINGYDVYIYWGSHQTAVVHTPSFTIGSQTFYLRDTTDTWDGTHTLSTATTAAAAVDGDNYVLFTGLHLVDLTVQVKRGGGAQRIGISGIQFVSTGPAATVPVAPSGLSARPVNDTMVRLNWSDNSNSETGSWQTIATLPESTSSYVDRSLTASTDYTYRVRAANAVGETDWSNEASATTLPPGVTGAPRLFISQSRLEEMKTAIAVPGSTMNEAFLAMKARVDAADWHVYDDNATDGNWNYDGRCNLRANRLQRRRADVHQHRPRRPAAQQRLRPGPRNDWPGAGDDLRLGLGRTERCPGNVPLIQDRPGPGCVAEFLAQQSGQPLHQQLERRLPRR